MKIVTVLGARPQFIKAAAVSRVIGQYSGIEEIIVHTGQHHDANMSDIFFEQMSVPKPDYQLEIAGLNHGAMTGRMLEEVEDILVNEKPDAVMVYGDTNTTLAGALAASKLHIPIAHVESGLRSYNMRMPEEVNRVLTDRISSILFCPTENAVQNLIAEGYEKLDGKIIESGDVMLDAAMFYADSAVVPSFYSGLDVDDEYILVTVHRAENTDNPEKLNSIMESLCELAQNRSIIFPVHPRTRQKIGEYIDRPGINFVDPVGYMEMIWLMKNSGIIITDSGGLQKEAFFFEKPCITLREETEWVELVDCGANIIAGTSRENIISAYNDLIGKDIPISTPLYGSGNASNVVVESLLSI